MWRAYALVLLLFVANAGRAETPALLDAALQTYLADAERWAFTQTSHGTDAKGREKLDRVTRFDPSQPYEEQWTPLLLEGKAPTEREIERYRKRQEKRRKNRPSFGEILAFDRAVLVEENATAATYEIPLLKTGNRRFPLEKFRVTARVNKASQSFEVISVRVRESWRVAVVGRVKSGEIDLHFSTVDPQFAPTITSLSGEAEATVLFVKVGGSYTLTRTEFKRVTPYSERFKVRIAPLQFLDF